MSFPPLAEDIVFFFFVPKEIVKQLIYTRCLKAPIDYGYNEDQLIIYVSNLNIIMHKFSNFMQKIHR